MVLGVAYICWKGNRRVDDDDDKKGQYYEYESKERKAEKRKDERFKKITENPDKLPNI